jgi:hypothetical protein
MIMITLSLYPLLFYRLDDNEVKTAIKAGFQTLFLLWNLLFLVTLFQPGILNRYILVLLIGINLLVVLPILRSVVLFWSRRD